MGRPPNPGPKPETKSIRLDLSPEEHRDLRIAAALADMSMAAYARKVVSESARKDVSGAGKGTK